MEKKRAWLWPLPAAGLGVLLAIPGRGSEAAHGKLFILPELGRWLRALSLGSAAGNALAWVVVLILTAMPLLALLLIRRRRGWAWEDILLPLLSVLLFVLCYFLVNPTLLRSPAADFFPLACVGALLSAAFAWFAFRILRAMEAAPTDRLAAAARPLLIGCASLMALRACYLQTSVLLARWSAVVEGNTVGGIGFTLFSLTVLCVLTLLPDLLAVLTLLWGAELAGVLGSPAFDSRTIDLCRRTAQSCRTITAATVLIAVLTNLLQLLLFRALRSTYFSVVIPLFPLVLSVALYLLCRCLQRGKELQDDSDSII